MADTVAEPEVVAANLRELGCPFDAFDPRATVWLEGYRAGVQAMFDAGQIILEARHG